MLPVLKTLVTLIIGGALLNYSHCNESVEVIDGLELDSTICDFGDIPVQRVKARHSFRLKNNSKDDFRILYIYKSCSCLTYKLSNHILKHGSFCQLEVSVDLSKEDKGFFCHKLTVAIEGAKKPLILTIKGRINEFTNL